MFLCHFYMIVYMFLKCYLYDILYDLYMTCFILCLYDFSFRCRKGTLVSSGRFLGLQAHPWTWTPKGPLCPEVGLEGKHMYFCYVFVQDSGPKPGVSLSVSRVGPNNKLPILEKNLLESLSKATHPYFDNKKKTHTTRNHTK